MKAVPTFTATIYCGLKERVSRLLWNHSDARALCQRYVDAVGLCVTYTETTFLYTDGNERGCIVGLINYPRFPSTPDMIRNHALRLAGMLKERFGQLRVSIVFPDETVMLGEDSDPAPEKA